MRDAIPNVCLHAEQDGDSGDMNADHQEQGFWAGAPNRDLRLAGGIS
jgi:hypothetical protein